MRAATYSSGGAGRPAQPGDAKTICFDLDGTLCTNTSGDYESAEPFPWAIARLNQLADAGHRIVIFTARGTATGIDWEPLTRAQLERWRVSYDDLRFGKPSAAVYVDDRAVHTSAWREGDAFTVPGLGLPVPAGIEELPGVLPPQRTAVVESGRTFAGEPFLLDRHVGRARALAAACGVRTIPNADELRSAVEEALRASSGLGVAPGEDLIYTISIADAIGAAFVDMLDTAPAPGLRVSCRTLGQAAAGVWRLLDPGAQGEVALAASIAGRSSGAAWPLEAAPDGSLRDGLGGRLAISRGGEVAVAPEAGPPAILSGWLGELADACRLDLRERPLSPDDLRRADEAFVVSFAFGPLRLGRLDDVPLGTTGSAHLALRKQWSSQVGVDIAAQLGSAVVGSSPERGPA